MKKKSKKDSKTFSKAGVTIKNPKDNPVINNIKVAGT